MYAQVLGDAVRKVKRVAAGVQSKDVREVVEKALA